MKSRGSITVHNPKIQLYTFCISISLLVLLGFSLWFSLKINQDHTRDVARIHAQVALERDLAYRMWNASHGGVYVPVSPEIQPNPYLEVPNRDLNTKEGLELTLINPAYMTRLVHEISTQMNGVKGHITSLNPIRPENAADAWETKALKQFANGTLSVLAEEQIEGEPHLRLMRPLSVQEGCLKCHAKQGFKLGDIRGGVSISVPLSPYLAEQKQQHTKLVIIHLLLTAAYLGAISWSNRRMNRQISKQQNTLIELDQSKNQMLELVRRLPMPAHLIDENEKVLLMNDAFKQTFGYSCEDFINGNRWWPTVCPDPEYRAHVKQLWKDYVQNINSGKQTGALREVRLRTKTGDERIVDFNLSKFGNRSLVVLDDVTDWIKKEDELSLMASALEAAANGIAITDADAKIQWVNPAFSEMTGYSKEEIVGNNPRILKSGTQSEAFYKSMWDTLNAGKVWSGLIVNKHKNGKKYEEDMTITPVIDKEGAITNYIAIKKDVTDRKQLERQFLRSQRMESLGLLAGGVAHDLNNVLAPIMMSLEMLDKGLEPNKRRKLIAGIQNGCERGSAIIKQILAFSRGLKGEHVPVQVRHLIKDMVKFTRETFPKNISIVADIPRDLWLLSADATQIHQVLLNVAINAKDAMPQGGKLTFDAKNVVLQDAKTDSECSDMPGHYVMISIKDTGIGMSQDVVDHIFDPFLTTKAMGKGTGLGLSTAMGVVKNHKGVIDVKSEVGCGSTITIWLPASDDQTIESETVHPERPTQGHGETILVVDDEESVRKTTELVLCQSGYKALLAEDGSEAVAIFAERGNEIALVITDIMMPIMDGVDMSRILKRMRPDVRIIGASGLVDEPGKQDRSQELKTLGIHTTLMKPFRADTLLSTVYEALDPDQI
jgi:two-component system cell cycle sensor histidine kinase/response regulator CckA